MADNENTTTETAQAATNEQYIEALAELKRNTVSRDEYNKIKGENAKLLTTLVNGGTLSPEEANATKRRSVDECRKVIFSETTNNLDYAKAALELREQLMEKGETDPFLPYGQKILPTEEDVVIADRVAKTLQECIDYADGNSDIFTQELMRRTVDIPSPRKGR